MATVDLSYTVDEIPQRNQKVSVGGQQISAGGPSANAAATFAFLGGHAALVTAIGTHPLASVIREDLGRYSVRVHDMAEDYHDPPPVSSIMVLRRTGERTVVSANAAVFSEIEAKFNERWLREVAIVQVDGHHMEMCIAAAQAAHHRGIPVVLDSGSWKPGMARLLPFVDTVICSDDFRPPGCHTDSDVFGFLSERKVPRVAITRGGSAIRFVDGDERSEIRVKKIRPRDTLGAGDIFHGAFCYYACRPGCGFGEALREAAAVATFSCRYGGTRSWMKAFER